MYEDDPQDLVFDVLGEAVFDTHPLGRPVIGRADVVRAIEREQLLAYHREHYTPQNVVVAAAGSIEHDTLVAMVSAAEPGAGTAQHGGTPAPAVPSARGGAGGPSTEGPGMDNSTPPAATARYEAEPCFERRVRFLHKDTEQYHLCLGGRGISRHDRRRYALRVLESVLGDTSSSRLSQEVRERRGLAYSVFSFSNPYAHTGEVGVYVGTRPDNLAEAVATIARELQRLCEDPASPQELTRARENLKGRAVLALESTAARMNYFGSALLAGLPILSLDEVIDRIDAVEVEHLQGLARELFAPAGLSAACVGADEEIFRQALEPLEVATAEGAAR